MIQIQSVEPSVTEYIDAIKDNSRVYLRRNSSQCWEQLYGESWEGIWEDSEFEKAYQNYMAR